MLIKVASSSLITFPAYHKIENSIFHSSWYTFILTYIDESKEIWIETFQVRGTIFDLFQLKKLTKIRDQNLILIFHTNIYQGDRNSICSPKSIPIEMKSRNKLLHGAHDAKNEDVITSWRHGGSFHALLIKSQPGSVVR